MGPVVETMIEMPALIADCRKRQLSSPGGVAGAAAPEGNGSAVLGFDSPGDGKGHAVPMELRLKRMHEVLRARMLAPPRFETRAVHLVLPAMLIKDHGTDAHARAVAARRSGASWDDLRCVAGLASALFGDRGTRRGKELCQALADREQQDRIAAAVVAYG